MTDLFVVEGLGTPFPDRFSKMMIDYIFSKWSISDPPKGASQKDPTVSLRFKEGFYDYHHVGSEIAAFELQTDPTGDIENGQKHYELLTSVEVGVRMKRIKKDEVDIQLHNMKNEVIRIATCYNTIVQDIPGVRNILWRGDNADFSGPQSWVQSNWAHTIHLQFWWAGQTISF